ncbi:uncharacterized protein LOC126409918 [Nymphaea colorata]|uniref:uncharacterized protein LOC116245349 n=1 Tax=Nymphaea colorata TaxID=210225 RepID=UPI00129E98A6|nr:uncharacterized protein LOC116245349 [Nymphaea colorata]XP_049931473.1 uncharacterized protein LOC116245349 [Nymphaea colorata]XP_049932777.1 uncharacterized protein LOC126409918 [Nymphaea colorata]XP_049932778.1 uncharacterized protein LOC126409918 [Nymphaea colorata]
MWRKEKQPVREVEETEIVEEAATAAHVEPHLTLPSADLSTLITSIQQLTAQQAAFMKETQVIHERLAHNQEEEPAYGYSSYEEQNSYSDSDEYEPSYASEDCNPIEEMDEEEGDDQQTNSESSDQGDEYSKASQHSEDERLTTNEIEDQSSDESCKEWGDDYGDPSPNDHSSSSPHEYRGFTLAKTRLYHPRISNFTFGYATSSGTTHKRESNYCEPLLPLVGHNRLHNYSPQNSTNPLRCGPTKAASLQPSTAISLKSTSSHSKPNKNQKIHNRADQQKGNKLKDILATSDLGRRPKPRTRSNFVNGPSLKTENRNQQLSKEPLKDPLPAAYNLREAIRKIQSSTKPDKMQQQKTTSSRVPVRNKMPIPARLEPAKNANVLRISPAMVRKKEQVAKAPEGAKVGDDGTATIREQPPAEKPHFTLTDALTMIRRIVAKNDELLEQMYFQRQNEQRTFLSAPAHGQGNGPQQEQAENSDKSDEEDEAVATREKPTGQFPTSNDKISDLLKDLKTGEHQTLERRNENIKNAEIHEDKELAPMDHIEVAATLYDQLESIPWSTFTASEASSKEDGDDNTNFSARKNGNCGQLEWADLGQNVLKQLPNTTFVLKTNNSLHMPTFAHYLKAEVHPQVRLIFDHGKSIQGSATKCYKELHKRMESQLGRLPIDYGPCYPLLLIGWFKAKLGNELAALGERCRARPKRLKGQVYDRGRLHGAAILSDNPRHQDQRRTLLGLLQRDYGPARSKASLDKSGRFTLGDCQGRAWGQARSKGGGSVTGPPRSWPRIANDAADGRPGDETSQLQRRASVGHERQSGPGTAEGGAGQHAVARLPRDEGAERPRRAGKAPAATDPASFCCEANVFCRVRDRDAKEVTHGGATAAVADDDAKSPNAPAIAEESTSEGTTRPREVDEMTAPHSTRALTPSEASPSIGGLHAKALGHGEATLPTQAKPDVLERSGLDLARGAQLAGHDMETGCSGQRLTSSRLSNGGRTDWTGTGVVQAFRTETELTDRTDSHRTGTEDVLTSGTETVQETETGRYEGRLDRV